MTSRFDFERLAAHHDRESFSSGVEPLDRYLRTQAGQEGRRRMSACFVAVERETGVLGGYYTLAASSVRLADMPERVARKLPRYPTVPAARLGRLAVDERFRGQGLGAAVLWDALTRASASEIAAFALVVDAKDDTAVAFYRHHDFEPLGNDPRTLFRPLSGIEEQSSE